MDKRVKSIKLEELKAFLVRANMPRADGTAKIVKEADGSRTITYTEGDYRMHDNFFGGEPYGGRLVIFYNERPVFIEVYYGTTNRPADEVYAFLREALQHPSKANPFRGPAEYRNMNLTYRSSVEGDISNHTVKEYIYDEDKEVYSAVIMGGLVDRSANNAM